MEITIKVLVHLLPLVPFAMGYYFIALAVFLAVALCYVKVMKLSQLIQEASDPDPSLTKARNFWRRLTFMKD